MEIIEITTKEELDKVVSENKKVLVDFWAPWCGPCRMVNPTIEEIAEEDNDIVVVKVNTDYATDLTIEMSVKSIPTFYTYVDSVHIETLIGAGSKNTLLDTFQ